MSLTCKNYSLSTNAQAGVGSLTVGIIYTNCETNSSPPGAIATLIENQSAEDLTFSGGQNAYFTEICSRTQPVIPNDPYGIAVTEIGTCTEPPVTVTPTPTPTPLPNRCIVSTDCGNNGIDPIDNRNYICGSPFDSVALSTGLQVYGTCTKLYGALYVANPAAAVTPDAYNTWLAALPLTNKLIAITGTEFTRPLTNPTPSAGYRFVNWTPATGITNNDDVTFTANYELIPQSTTVTLATEPQTGGGTIAITSGDLVGVAGRNVTIGATPASTHDFTRFEVRNSTTNNLISTVTAVTTGSITVQVDGNRKVTAFFTQKTADPVVTIAPASTAVTVAQGASVSNTINITRTNYTGNVSLVLANLPAGVTAAITPNSTTEDAFSIGLTTLATATVGGPVTVTCTATYGNRTATTTFQLTVTRVGTPTLSLSVAPTSVTMQKSASTTATVTATTTDLSDQQRVTTVTVAVPPNANATVPAITVTGTGQLRITTTAASVPGQYTLTLTGRTASNPAVTATTNLTLIIQADDTRTVTYAKTPLAAGYTLPNTQTVNVNASILLPEAPSAAGYTFDGWFVGNDRRFGNQIITDDTTFTARFTAITQTRTVRYEKTPPAAGYTLPLDQTVNVNTRILLPQVLAPGYTFDGWFVGNELRSGTQTITDDTTFTARFTAIITPTRTVRYEKTPLAAGYTLPNTQTVNVNTSILLPPASAIGYTFDGWFVGNDSRSGTQTITDDTTFTARFTQVTVTPPVTSAPPDSPVAFSPSLTPLIFTYQRGTASYPLPVTIRAINNSSRSRTVRLDTNQQFNFIRNGTTTTGTLTLILPPNSSQEFTIVPTQVLFGVGGLNDGDTQFPITITDS